MTGDDDAEFNELERRFFTDVVGTEVTDVEVEWSIACPYDTCEFSEGDITLTLADGRRLHASSTFGWYVNELVRDAAQSFSKDGPGSGGKLWRQDDFRALKWSEVTP